MRTSQAPQQTPAEKFVEQARGILSGWLQRISLQGDIDQEDKLLDEHPDDWMRRKSYKLVRQIAEKSPEVIEQLFGELDSKHRRGPKTDNQPFKRALLLMVALPSIREGTQNSPLPKLISDRKRRAELSDAMRYASLHKVHSKHFNGFYKQVGFPRIQKMLEANRYEPGFERLRPRQR